MTAPALFVLGMHRSGTSALTRAMGLLGFAQSSKLLAANVANPAGYWESQAAVALNTDFLRKLHRYWADPKPVDLSHSDAHLAQAQSGAREILTAEFDPKKGGVLKDPRMCLTFPAWRAAAEGLGMAPMCLISLRNPRNVCASLRRRNEIRIAHGEKLWMSYMLRAEHYSRDLPRAVVRYENLLADWRDTLEVAVHSLGLEFPNFDVQNEAEMSAFLDPQLDHSAASDAAFFEAAEHSDGAKDLYRLFCEPDSLQRRDAFDAIRGAWRADWALKSKGDGASFYGRRFPDWHLRHAIALEDAGDRAGAIEACLEAVDIDPEHTHSLYRLAKLYFEREQYQEALGPISIAAGLCPDRRVFHMLHARILEKLHRFEEAQTQAEAAIEAEPTWPEAHFMRAQMLLKRRDMAAALEGFEQVIAMAGRIPRYQKAYERAKSQPLLDARTAIDAPEAEDVGPTPDLAQARRYIDDKNWQAAQKLLEQIVAQDDAPLTALQYYATAVTRLGHVDASIAALERITRLAPTSARHQFLLAGQRCLTADWAGAEQARDAATQIAEAELAAWASSAAEDAVAPVPFTVTSALSWQAAQHWHSRLLALGDESGADDLLWPKGGQRPRAERPEIAKVEGDARPELSVMLPVYNVQNPSWLRGAIDSVLGQLDPSDAVEVIVLDDASSTDTAMQIAAEYGQLLRYVRNPHQLGLLENHNAAIRIARGEFVHILHQDDWVLDGFYDALLAPLRADPRVSMGFCAARIVDGDDRQIRVPAQLADASGVLHNWLARIVHGQLINFPSVIVRRAAYEACGGFTPSLSFAFDWEMWARLAAHGAVWHDTGVRAVYRNHGTSATHLFSAHERLIDCFHTISSLLLLLPERDAAQIGPHALMRVIANNWAQVRLMGPQAEGLDEALDFLLQGCRYSGDAHQLMELVNGH